MRKVIAHIPRFPVADAAIVTGKRITSENGWGAEFLDKMDDQERIYSWTIDGITPYGMLYCCELASRDGVCCTLFYHPGTNKQHDIFASREYMRRRDDVVYFQTIVVEKWIEKGEPNG